MNYCYACSWFHDMRSYEDLVPSRIIPSFSLTRSEPVFLASASARTRLSSS